MKGKQGDGSLFGNPRLPLAKQTLGKQGDGSSFGNPRLPLAKKTFIGMMIMPGKQ